MKNFIFNLVLLCAIFFAKFSTAQNVTITDDATHNADTSAILDLKSETKGFLVPRLTTTQVNNIQNPATGLLVFNSQENTFYYYTGENWIKLTSGNPSNIWIQSDSLVYLGDTLTHFGIGTKTPVGKLEVKADPTIGDNDPLFEVKNKEGDPVFTVYPNGVHVFVDESAKGSIGGFAVSGRSATKALNDYMRVTQDSTRIYINESTAKGNIGGFAVSGRSATKQTVEDYLNVTIDTTQIINPSQPRILWYPTKEAFLTGKVLIEDPDSVGKNSFASGYESKAIGNWSQALGYKTIARRDYATAIGYKAVADRKNTIAIGDSAIASGLNSIAFGSAMRDFTFYDERMEDSVTINAGGPLSSGKNSLAIGYGAYASGDASIAIGAQDTATKPFSIAMGRECKASAMYSSTIGGYKNIASGFFSFIGGGQENMITNQYSAIIGGVHNDVSGQFAGVLAGSGNTASGQNAAIAGGASNIADNTWAFIGGGNMNIASHSNTVVVGGTSDTASGNHSSIINGKYNRAEGWYSTVINGSYNKAYGQNSLILGGRYNKTNDFCEVILGQYATIGAGSQYLWEDSDRIFVIGNGSSTSNRSDAVKILKDGSVYFPGVYSQTISGGKELFIDSTGQIGVHTTKTKEENAKMMARFEKEFKAYDTIIQTQQQEIERLKQQNKQLLERMKALEEKIE